MQGKPITKANLELKNFRFYFAKTKPSYCMMCFSVLKSVSCMSLEVVFHLALQIEKSLGTEKWTSLDTPAFFPLVFTCSVTSFHLSQWSAN